MKKQNRIPALIQLSLFFAALVAMFFKQPDYAIALGVLLIGHTQMGRLVGE